jgi:propane 2-monooxygenase small subunit
MATETPAPSKDDEVPPPVVERSVPKPVFTDAEAGAREFPSSTSRSYNYFTPAKRRATVYEDVTVDIQPDPARHLLQGWVYGFANGKPGGYPQEWTALKSSNWHEFLDPNEEWEQTIYRNNANVVRQIHQNLENARAARAFQNWNRGWIQVVQRHVSAWAHVEHGIGMHVYLPAQRDAPTNMINNALSVASAHKLRFGQDMILYNLELSEEIEGFDGEAHKEAWTQDPIWQGVRRNVEELTGIRDWAEAFFAATVVFEPLVGELFRSEFVMQAAAPQGDFVTPTLMGAGESDTARDARVSRRLFSMLADDDQHGEENRHTMQGWLNEWAQKSLAAGRDLQPIWSQPGEKVIRFEESFEHARKRFDERLTELNLDGKDLA